MGVWLSLPKPSLIQLVKDRRWSYLQGRINEIESAGFDRHGSNILILAIIHGAPLELLLKILQSYPRLVSLLNSRNESALSTSIIFYKTDTVITKKLLDIDFNLAHVVDSNGSSPIHIIAYRLSKNPLEYHPSTVSAILLLERLIWVKRATVCSLRKFLQDDNVITYIRSFLPDSFTTMDADGKIPYDFVHDLYVYNSNIMVHVCSQFIIELTPQTKYKRNIWNYDFLFHLCCGNSPDPS